MTKNRKRTRHPKRPLLDQRQLVRQQAGTDISVHGEVTSAFDYYLDWLGHEKALMLLLDDPDRAKMILRHFAEGIAVLADDMCGEDIDAACGQLVGKVLDRTRRSQRLREQTQRV